MRDAFDARCSRKKRAGHAGEQLRMAGTDSLQGAAGMQIAQTLVLLRICPKSTIPRSAKTSGKGFIGDHAMIPFMSHETSVGNRLLRRSLAC